MTNLAAAAAAKSRQSCPTLCDPIDGSPPGSSVHGILQARVLEWVAIVFSRVRDDRATKPPPPPGLFPHVRNRDKKALVIRNKWCTMRISQCFGHN